MYSIISSILLQTTVDQALSWLSIHTKSRSRDSFDFQPLTKRCRLLLASVQMVIECRDQRTSFCLNGRAVSIPRFRSLNLTLLSFGNWERLNDRVFIWSLKMLTSFVLSLSFVIRGLSKREVTSFFERPPTQILTRGRHLSLKRTFCSLHSAS